MIPPFPSPSSRSIILLASNLLTSVKALTLKGVLELLMGRFPLDSMLGQDPKEIPFLRFGHRGIIVPGNWLTLCLRSLLGLIRFDELFELFSGSHLLFNQAETKITWPSPVRSSKQSVLSLPWFVPPCYEFFKDLLSVYPGERVQ